MFSLPGLFYYRLQRKIQLDIADNPTSFVLQWNLKLYSSIVLVILGFFIMLTCVGINLFQ